MPEGPLCTRASLAHDLKTIGVKPGSVLLLHSSMSRIGWVCGGVQTVVLALLDVLGKEGTLVVPAFTAYNTDPHNWGRPPVPKSWHDEIRAHTPAFDPHFSQTRGMGVIPELVRTLPGAVRSAHPQTSFAAIGPAAEKLMAVHDLECRLGERSPLRALEEAGAYVLLLGVGFERCTSFHLSQYRVPGESEEIGFAVMTPSGRQWQTAIDMVAPDDPLPDIGKAFDATPEVTQGKIGAASTKLFSMPVAVKFAVDWLKEDMNKS